MYYCVVAKSMKFADKLPNVAELEDCLLTFGLAPQYQLSVKSSTQLVSKADKVPTSSQGMA